AQGPLEEGGDRLRSLPRLRNGARGGHAGKADHDGGLRGLPQGAPRRRDVSLLPQPVKRRAYQYAVRLERRSVSADSAVTDRPTEPYRPRVRPSVRRLPDPSTFI